MHSASGKSLLVTFLFVAWANIVAGTVTLKTCTADVHDGDVVTSFDCSIEDNMIEVVMQMGKRVENPMELKTDVLVDNSPFANDVRKVKYALPDLDDSGICVTIDPTPEKDETCVLDEVTVSLGQCDLAKKLEDINGKDIDINVVANDGDKDILTVHVTAEKTEG